MRKVRREEILDYQTYDEKRDAIRAAVLRAKEPRRIHVGPNLTFLFENTETIRYQIQEMMRAERIVKEAEIQHEIATYNEVLGDVGELGCTLLIEVEDPKERDVKLTRWKSLPRHLYMRTETGKKVYAQVDERQLGERRVSSVQYLKFKLGEGQPVALGCDDPEYSHETSLSDAQKKALNEDARAT